MRLVLEHQRDYPSQWAAIRSIAAKCGMTTKTLRKWVRRAEVDAGARAGLTTDERERLRELERENRELRRANEILRAASAFSRGSSTRDCRDDPLHRCPPGTLRGRADLPGDAGRPVHLLRSAAATPIGSSAITALGTSHDRFGSICSWSASGISWRRRSIPKRMGSWSGTTRR